MATIPTRVTIIPTDLSMLAAAEKLATSLQLTICANEQEARGDGYDFALLATATHLAVQNLHAKNWLPFWINFSNRKQLYRIQHASRRSELIIRAMGHRLRDQTHLIDATAGTGEDSLLLASLGFNVTLIERSPILHALLQDALQRASTHPALQPFLPRMQLVLGEAVTVLQMRRERAERPDIVYLDPMFPTRQKQAAVRKEMQLLQALLADAHDNSVDLLNMALTCATSRVVVKRPRLGTTLTTMAPSFTISGNSSRFDIYTINE